MTHQPEHSLLLFFTELTDFESLFIIVHRWKHICKSFFIISLLFLPFVLHHRQCQADKYHCKQSLNPHCHVNPRCCFLCEGGVFSQEFIDLFVPVYRQEAGYCENFFIHDIHGYEDTAEETHPQGDHIGESTEHITVFGEHSDQIGKG